jgi:hypothetical protein
MAILTKTIPTNQIVLFKPKNWYTYADKPSQSADFFVREKVALTHVKQQQ